MRSLALVWVVLVLALYYWIHKPITPALARAVGGAVLDSATGLAIVLVAAGVGRRVLRTIDTSYWNEAERVAATALVGLCCVALGLLFMGTLALTRPGMLAVGGVLGILVWRDLVGWVGDTVRILRVALPIRRWDRLLAGFVISMLIITGLLALLPPSKWDVLTYHLAGPQHYIERGHFYAVPHNHFLGFPQLVETLFSAQLALTGRLTAAGFLHWLIGVLVLLVTGGYAARHAGTAAGWLAAGTLLSGVSFWQEMTFAYVDLLPMGLAVIALSLTDRWDRLAVVDQGRQPDRMGISIERLRRERYRIVLWVGLLAGFGLGVKYSVLWLAIALGVLVVWLTWRDRWLVRLVYGVLFGVAAFAVFMPWLVRNVCWYTNPFYPFVFEAGEMDVLRQEWYSQPRSGLAYSADAWQIPVLPLTATFLGVEGAGTYGTDVGPLYLMLVPLLLLARGELSFQQRSVIARALIIGTSVLVLWGLSAAIGSYISLQTRLVFYAFSPLAVIAAITLEGLRRLPQKPFNLHFVLQAMVAMALTFTLVDAVRFLNNSGLNRYFSGKDDYEQAYLEHALGWHYVAMRQINQLPPGTVVRLLWEPRYLYCDTERITCHTDSLMDAWYYARRTIGDGSPTAIAQAWQDQGAEYLLVYEFGRQYEQEHASLYDEADWTAWQEFVQRALVEVWRNGNTTERPQYILYRWGL